MMQGISPCDHVTERDATGELALFCEACGVSITNQDFVCLLWGKAEVRVAHYPLGTQNKRLLYFGKAEVHVACGVPKNL